MKKCVLIISLLIVCNVLTFSQFKEGYIIKNSNDTIFGFINWQGSAINTTQCEFRVTPDGPAEVYKPGDIKAFRFNNSKYFSTYEIKTGDQAEVVFIEWLIKGRASLLAFTGSVAEPRFFLLTEDGALTELTNTTYEFVNEGVVYQRKKQEYINTLLFNFRDCATLEPKIKATGFKSKSLLNLTKQYHELTCKTEDCIIFEDRARALVLNYGVSAGFLNSQWILNNKVPEKVYPSTTTGFGAAMSISNLPVLPPRFSVKIGLGFYSSVYSYDTADFYRVISDDRIMKVNYFKIPAQLSYRFTYSKFSPYVSAGTTFNVRFTYKQYEQILTDFITVSKYLDHYIAEVNPFQFGANAGFGFDYTVSPKLSFNLGYDFEYGFRQYGTYPDDHSKLINHNVYLRAYFVSNRK